MCAKNTKEILLPNSIDLHRLEMSPTTRKFFSVRVKLASDFKGEDAATAAFDSNGKVEIGNVALFSSSARRRICPFANGRTH